MKWRSRSTTKFLVCFSSLGTSMRLKEHLQAAEELRFVSGYRFSDTTSSPRNQRPFWARSKTRPLHSLSRFWKQTKVITSSDFIAIVAPSTSPGDPHHCKPFAAVPVYGDEPSYQERPSSVVTRAFGRLPRSPSRAQEPLSAGPFPRTPGVGKGTQAEILTARLGSCHLSTGDVFRAAAAVRLRINPQP